MRSASEVAAVRRLAAQGVGATAIARSLGVPRSTVRDWLDGRIPRHLTDGACPTCRGRHTLSDLPSQYVHLLGLYLGDGCLSAHPRGVYKLRIFLDVAYPGIIDGAARSVAAVRGRPPHRRTTDTNYVEVFASWRQWPCLLPQHGPGPKHRRPIVLSGWQRELVERWPEQLVRGLIESDGCRFTNTGRNGWSAARYAFSNRSADIHAIFRDGCERVGVRWTAAGPHTTYVSRIADVAVLDEFVGPKR